MAATALRDTLSAAVLCNTRSFQVENQSFWLARLNKSDLIDILPGHLYVLWPESPARLDANPQAVDRLAFAAGLRPCDPVVFLVDSEPQSLSDKGAWLMHHRDAFLRGLEQSGAEFLRRLLLALPLGVLNPYQCRLPATGPMFFGRSDDLTDLCDPDGPSVALVGARRIGKTSLVQAVNDRLRTRRHKPAAGTQSAADMSVFRCALQRVDCFALLKDVWYELFKQIALNESELALSRRYRRKLSPRKLAVPLGEFDWFREALARRYRHTCLILDECDAALRRDRAIGWEFFSQLQALVDDADLCVRVILVGYEELLAALNTHAFPLSKVSQRIESRTLGGLSPSEVERLVLQPPAALGVNVENSGECVRRIVDASSGLPSIIQQVCHIAMADAEVGSSRLLTPMAVQRAIGGLADSAGAADLVDQVEDRFARLVMFLSARETHHAHGESQTISLRRVLQMLNRAKYFSADLTVSRAFEQLCLYNIMRAAGDGEYAFSYPAVRDLVHSRASDEAVNSLLSGMPHPQD